MKFKKFTKSQRSTFEYWFYHWLAFNYTAIKLRHWRIKYLFHDIEKPFLRILFKKNYSKVQKWHRQHNRHHIEYIHPEKRNWIDMVIDWECSHLTKIACPNNAIEEIEHKYNIGEITLDEKRKLLSACDSIIFGKSL